MVYKTSIPVLVLFLAAFPFFSPQISTGHAQTILEEWDKAKAPEPIKLKSVKVNPAETAFLILDIQKSACNSKRRPRCVASVPKIAKFLEQAKSKGVTVVYSLAGRAKPKDILSGVAPKTNEPIVKSSVDKFYKTDLEKILRETPPTCNIQIFLDEFDII